MQISIEMLEEQVELTNNVLKDSGSNYVLHIEMFNELMWVKNQRNETIVWGTPVEVYHSLKLVRACYVFTCK